MSENLDRIAGQHTVKEVAISFTLSPQIGDIEKYRTLLKEGKGLSERFHKFEPLMVRHIKVDSKLDKTEIIDSKESGFKIMAFESGKTSDVIQAIPQPQQTILSYNTVNYSKWKDFVQNVLSSIMTISELIPDTKVIAVGVMFVDEFFFDNENEYNPKDLFNFSSENLPKSILESDLYDYNISSHQNKGEFNYIENISIKVFNDNEAETEKKVIRISGNTMSQLPAIPFIQLMNMPELENYLNFGHDQNKSMLQSILTQNTLKAIKIV